MTSDELDRRKLQLIEQIQIETNDRTFVDLVEELTNLLHRSEPRCDSSEVKLNPTRQATYADFIGRA